MRRYNWNRWLLPVAAVVAVSACAELEVTNPNNPATELVLAEPADIETLIRDSYYLWWNNAKKDEHIMALSVVSGQTTSSWGNWAMFDVGRIPREPFPNTLTYPYRGVLTRPWGGIYNAAKSAYDGLTRIDDGMQIIVDGEDHTARARAFAKFVQGIAHAEIAMAFDQGFILSEELTLVELADLELVPYDEVMDFALEALDEALTLSGTAFTIPASWMRTPASMTNQEFQQLLHAFRARYTAAGARNPTEGAAMDWDAVLYHTDPARTITTDYNVEGDGVVWWTRQGIQLVYDTWARAAHLTVGPADVSGAYRAWLNAPLAQRTGFDIVTPDTRITPPGEPKGAGSLFGHWAAVGWSATIEAFNQARGSYFNSWYRYHAYDWFYDVSFVGPQPEVPVSEVELLRAEALIRRNRAAEAVLLINKYRAAGDLPEVTVDGASGADCVPRLDGATCANLMESMQYEKRLMAYASGGVRVWTDARRWGDLPEGSIIHLPVPASELLLLQLPIYTTGGVGQPGGFPNP